MRILFYAYYKKECVSSSFNCEFDRDLFKALQAQNLDVLKFESIKEFNKRTLYQDMFHDGMVLGESTDYDIYIVPIFLAGPLLSYGKKVITTPHDKFVDHYTLSKVRNEFDFHKLWFELTTQMCSALGTKKNMANICYSKNQLAFGKKLLVRGYVSEDFIRIKPSKYETRVYDILIDVNRMKTKMDVLKKVLSEVENGFEVLVHDISGDPEIREMALRFGVDYQGHVTKDVYIQTLNNTKSFLSIYIPESDAFGRRYLEAGMFTPTMTLHEPLFGWCLKVNPKNIVHYLNALYEKHEKYIFDGRVYGQTYSYANYKYGLSTVARNIARGEVI